MTSHAAPALSVLDLVPVRAGQTSAQAVAASLDLAVHADRLGYRRYWFAEHHNMPAVASTTPPVLIAAAASRTERIRVGSGGVMLPNHAPLIVAEQFAALEAIAPGRIDLGIGRAPGSDPVITQLLRQSGATSDVERFPDHIRDILALSRPRARPCASPPAASTRCTRHPRLPASPEVWLLGSSDYSAQLAASLGLPYVFANHFSGEGLERALDAVPRPVPCRTKSTPSRGHFLTVNAVAAPTAEEAEARALPQLRMMARLRTEQAPHPARDRRAGRGRAARRHGRALGRARDVVHGSARSRWLIGTGADVAPRSPRFAARHGVDEVMLSPGRGRLRRRAARDIRRAARRPSNSSLRTCSRPSPDAHPGFSRHGWRVTGATPTMCDG